VSRPTDSHPLERIVLVDPNESARATLARRLTSLGYHVEVATDGVEGATLALSNPPAAVLADLWMPGVSGIQLCRLLRTECATMDVPVILRGDEQDRRNRFWAGRAGAFAFLGKGRVGELLREMRRAIDSAPARDDFFIQFAAEVDIRDRIAQRLDEALFESVVAAEVRSLGSCDSFERLFDVLAQFVSQVHPYRWLALHVPGVDFLGLHCHPANGAIAGEETWSAIDTGEAVPFVLEDEDAVSGPPVAPPIVAKISFGGRHVGTIALAPAKRDDADADHRIEILSRELGGPLRMISLVEETQRLAATDALTRVLNRRAFLDRAAGEIARIERYGGTLSLALLDVDHFKSVNDRFGHATGDRVLVTVAKTVSDALRGSDVLARWGGEEFVVAFPVIDASQARLAAERLRRAIESIEIPIEGRPEALRVTASLGVAELSRGETIESVVERADAAMYRAKQGGRNRVEVEVGGPATDASSTERPELVRAS
jgi:two-component system, cell cycle response regulator